MHDCTWSGDLSSVYLTFVTFIITQDHDKQKGIFCEWSPASYLAWSCCWSGGGGGGGATCSPRGWGGGGGGGPRGPQRWGGGGGGGPRGPQRWGGGGGGCGTPPILQSLSLYAMQCEMGLRIYHYLHSHFKLENLKVSLNLYWIKCWNFYLNETQKHRFNVSFHNAKKTYKIFVFHYFGTHKKRSKMSIA